ncbi:hypothetical protein KIPB_015439, partial [Kipferlia bialata]|eukprot:g15439.t1
MGVERHRLGWLGSSIQNNSFHCLLLALSGDVA